MQKKIAIFASGSGSNAENICDYFANSSLAEVVLICTNKSDAFIFFWLSVIYLSAVFHNFQRVYIP